MSKCHSGHRSFPKSSEFFWVPYEVTSADVSCLDPAPDASNAQGAAPWLSDTWSEWPRVLRGIHREEKQSIRPWHENECFFWEKNVTGTPPILWQKDLQKRFESTKVLTNFLRVASQQGCLEGMPRKAKAILSGACRQFSAKCIQFIN